MQSFLGLKLERIRVGFFLGSLRPCQHPRPPTSIGPTTGGADWRGCLRSMSWSFEPQPSETGSSQEVDCKTPQLRHPVLRFYEWTGSGASLSGFRTCPWMLRGAVILARRRHRTGDGGKGWLRAGVRRLVNPSPGTSQGPPSIGCQQAPIVCQAGPPQGKGTAPACPGDLDGAGQPLAHSLRATGRQFLEREK